MGNLDDFLNATAPAQVEEDIVEGAFDCQRCGKNVNGAKLDSRGNLVWTCECKFVSVIKDFWGSGDR